MKVLFFCVLAVFVCMQYSCAKEFVTVKNQRLYIGNEQYHYIGSNYWYGVNLGAPDSGNRDRVKKELDQLKSMGVNNLRIMAGGQGPDDREKRIVPSIEPAKNEFNEDVWLGFDFLLDEMAKRDMRAVVPINNYWEWSGGFGQYVEWEGGDFNDPLSFYNMTEVQEHFRNFISIMLNRTNTINGIKYLEDPTVMTWQLSNEPRIKNCTLYPIWIKDTTNYIKSLAPNHLVSIGNEGTITDCADEGDTVKEVDYITFHLWIQNWQWYDPMDPSSLVNGLKKAKEYLDENVEIGQHVKKPVVLEEFGIARDYNSYDPASTTLIRDFYYSFIFDYVIDHISEQKSNMVGTNFWSYGGFGRPSINGGMWKPGDDFIGDPPHERQGWYSVYNNDTTIEVISNYTSRLSQVKTPTLVEQSHKILKES